ncbi:MAG TPA: hypothetical protein DET40_07260 [Lentisphaeria bacterium]|nr:MAG: hypothetical protein A2X45_07040 [Lentisphaerae bacterium GWF2_50_93]HCE43330.1 hypothetical protein [Lentisphaeria bacterium]
MVRGLELFISHFKGMEDNYVLIGGCACDLWMTKNSLSFRPTEDIDMVIIVDALHPDFIRAFWDFIHKGDYQSLKQSRKKPKFYRFDAPKDPKYPEMIELLTRNILELPKGIHLTPIPVDDDISSLSAILLEEDYYTLVCNSKILINEAPTLPPQCLIPLKARAHLDLKKRKADGDTTVRSDDIRKHRNDVFRLLTTLTPEDKYPLSHKIAADLKEFLGTLPPGSEDWTAIRSSLNIRNLPAPDILIQRIKDVFTLN